jgi:hypothetical protein
MIDRSRRREEDEMACNLGFHQKYFICSSHHPDAFFTDGYYLLGGTGGSLDTAMTLTVSLERPNNQTSFGFGLKKNDDVRRLLSRLLPFLLRIMNWPLYPALLFPRRLLFSPSESWLVRLRANMAPILHLHAWDGWSWEMHLGPANGSSPSQSRVSQISKHLLF